MSYSVSVAHNFETAHRLPQLEGKCVSVHGHSWWTQLDVAGPGLDSDDVLVEFAALKSRLRAWIDRELDHGTMLGSADLLVKPLSEVGKVFVMPYGWWPSVERVAQVIGMRGMVILHDLGLNAHAQVARCTVRETLVNQATWRPEDG